jgi:hypothetical protein
LAKLDVLEDLAATGIEKMFERVPLLFRHALYELRGGFLIRPLVITICLGVTGAVLSHVEEMVTGIRDYIPSILFPSHDDPAVAGLILSNIAASGTTEEPDFRSLLADRAGRVAAGCAELPKEQLAKIKQRAARLASADV